MIKSNGRRRGTSYGMALVGGCAVLALSQGVSAATITVTTTSDNPVAGQCSLREALEAANTNLAVGACTAGDGPGDTVSVPAGTYVFTSAMQLEVFDDTNVIGAGAGSTIIDANGLSRVFNVQDSTSTFAGLTVRNGAGAASVDDSGSFISADGGGINADRSQLTVRDSVITGNSTTGDGGGIDSDGSGSSLTLIRVEISGNTAGNDGGGLRQDNSGGTTLTVIDSTISGNSSDDEGGGIHIDNSATVTISGSTISGNTSFRVEALPCSRGGGGINQDGGGIDSSLTITNSTISGNSAPNACGGGIFVRQAMELNNVTIVNNSARADAGGNVYRRDDNLPLQVTNSIIANATSGGDCATNGVSPVFGSGGGNIDSDNSCGFNAGTDQPGVNPLLGPLSANGGLTLTRLPMAGSPAIDRGVNASCESTDQRGISRPRDGNEDGVATCDVGATELDGAPLGPQEIPTLGIWMLGLLSALVALSGVFMQGRRRHRAA